MFMHVMIARGGWLTASPQPAQKPRGDYSITTGRSGKKNKKRAQNHSKIAHRSDRASQLPGGVEDSELLQVLP